MSTYLNSVPEGLGILKNKPVVPYTKYHDELYDIANRNVLDYLINDRKLTKETIRKFSLGASEYGEVVIPIFKEGELIDYKFRGIKEKSFRRIPDSETWILNDEVLDRLSDSKYLIITEGEYDAMAVWQMGCKSVVSGTGGANDKTLLWLSRLPDDESIKVYINFDNDEPGQKAALELADRIGIERCFNVILPTKDANDFIKEGHGLEEYKQILKDAKRFDIPGVGKIVDVIDELRNNPIQRIETPLKRFNIHTKGGIIKHGLVTISAKPGAGKSSLLLNFLIHHADEGIPVLLISLENDMMLTLQRILETKYKKPLVNFDDELWVKIKHDLANYPFYIERAKEVNSIKKLRKIVKQAKKLYGTEIVGYDHVGMITTRKDDLPEVVKDIYEIKNENNITMYIISHVRKGETGQRAVTGDDVYGTAAFHQLSNVLILLQNFGTGMELTIEKSRESTSHLRLPILFNGETGEMTDDMSRKVKFFDKEIEDNQLINPFVVSPNIDKAPQMPAGTPELDLSFLD